METCSQNDVQPRRYSLGSPGIGGFCRSLALLRAVVVGGGAVEADVLVGGNSLGPLVVRQVLVVKRGPCSSFCGPASGPCSSLTGCGPCCRRKQRILYHELPRGLGVVLLSITRELRLVGNVVEVALGGAVKLFRGSTDGGGLCDGAVSGTGGEVLCNVLHGGAGMYAVSSADYAHMLAWIMRCN